MWQTKYPLAVPKNFGVGVKFSAVQGRLFPLWASVVRGTSTAAFILLFFVTLTVYK